MIRAIFAADIKNGIGKNDTLPWPKNSNDLQWFRKCTENNIVMMGRKTWEDPAMPKPLPNRYNIVVTDRGLSSSDDRANMTIKRDKVKDYLDNIERDVWVIGGAKLLNSTINCVEEVWVSRMQNDYNCDTFINIPSNFTIAEECRYYSKNLFIEKWIKV